MSSGLIALILLCGCAAFADDALNLAQNFYRAGRWNDVVALWRGYPNAPPDLDYYAGMSLARLGKTGDARKALESGYGKSRLDNRFPTELAGLAFERKDFAAAKTYLARALRLDPQDSYASDFLGSIYFLEHNLEAALRYWNRIDKPHIEEIRVEPPLVNAANVDPAFAMSSASTLELSELHTTRAVLDLLGTLQAYRFELQPRQENEKFDLLLRASSGKRKTETLLSMFRGLPYQTLYPEFNLGGKGARLTSIARFDLNKLRLFLDSTLPVGSSPKQRLRFYLDGRRENWDLTRSFHGIGLAPVNLRLDKFESGGEFRSVVNGDWIWSTGAAVSGRRFTNIPPELVNSTFFAGGLLLKYRAQVDHTLLRVPERRLTITSTARAELGRLFARGFGGYTQVGASLAAHWLPQAQGDRYELTVRARAGNTHGPVPLDELFMLGLERDNDLPMAAHTGTQGGKKGSAPLGRTFYLINSDANRTIYDNGFLKVKLGPVLDTGKITDSSGAFGSGKWLVDTGALLRLSILDTVTVAVSYGRDLRSGTNAFYLTASR